MKNYHISIFKDSKENDLIVITKDIERRGIDFMFPDIKNAWKRRYIVNIGDTLIDIFGNKVTVKEILHHEETKTSNFLVEENGNTYRPNEFAGIFIKYLTEDEFNKLIN